jgi:hypothetical protein
MEVREKYRYFPPHIHHNEPGFHLAAFSGNDFAGMLFTDARFGDSDWFSEPVE